MKTQEHVVGASQQAGGVGSVKSGTSIIDCDIHYEPVSVAADLAPRVAPEWRRYLNEGFAANVTPYAHAAGFQRDDIEPEDGQSRERM